MGGYDIFKSTYDESKNTWSDPVNLDFAINTPDDDILYVTDSLEKTACFSSDRLSSAGRITVFKIRIDRKPVDISVINGTLVKGADDTRLNAKITVKNIDKNELVGIFNTDGTNGKYSLQLPNGGNFLFTVESAGFNVQSETVVVPSQKELKPLRQTISYEAGSGKLLITNYFDEPVSESDYLMALNLIKEKAKLEVNAGGPELFIGPNSNTLDASNPDNGGVEPSSNKKLSNDELVRIANEDAEEVQKDAKDLRAESDLAKSIADSKNQEAQAKSKEADQLLTNALNIQDPAGKQAELDKGNELKKQSESIAKETVVAYNLAKKLDDDAISKQEEADLSVKYAKDIENAVKSPNSKDALARLDAQKNRLEDISKQPIGTDNAYQSIKKDIENKQKQQQKLIEDTVSIREEIPQLQEEAKKLRADAGKTKKEDLKQGMLDQAKEIDDDIAQKQKQVGENDIKIKQLAGEAESLTNEAEVVNKLIEQIKTGSGISTTALPENRTAAQAEKPISTAGKEPTESQQAAPGHLTQPTGGTNETGKISLADNTQKNENQPKDTTASAGTKPPVAEYNQVHLTTVKTAADYSDTYTVELAKADSLPNEYDREIAKAGTDKKWAEAIKKDIAKKQGQIAAAKTPGQKQAIANKIKQLDQQLKEKETAEQLSLAKAEQLKHPETATSIATVGGSQNSVSADYRQKYVQQLNDTTKLEDTYEKEVAKATINKQWANTIDTDIEVKKQKLDVTTDVQAKISLENDIKNLEQESQEKRKSAEESTVYAGKIKQRETLLGSEDINGRVDQAADGAETPVNYTDVYSKELDAAEKNTNEFDKEFAKAVVNKKWLNSLDADIEQKKTALASAGSKKAKAELNKNIADLSQQIIEKQAVQQKGLDKLETLRQQELAKSTSKKPVVVSKEYTYTTTEASQKAVQMEALIQESGNLKKHADSERESAEKLSDPSEKNKKITMAAEEEEQALQKQVEADEVASELNKVEFFNNQSNLDQLVQLSANNKADEVSVAELSKDEAKILFVEALKMKDEANTKTDVAVRADMLERANNKEIQGLEKQQKAKDIYLKYYPSYVFKDYTSKSGTGTTSTPALSSSQPAGSGNQENASQGSSGKQTQNTTSSTAAPVSTSVRPAIGGNPENSSLDSSVNQTQGTSSAVTPVTSVEGTKQEDNQLSNAGSDQAIHPPSAKEANEEKMDEIKTKKEYKDFYALKAEAEAALKDAKNQYNVAEQLRKKGEEQVQRSQDILAQADAIQDENKKQEAYQQAIELANEAKRNLAKSDSVFEFAKNTEAAGKSKQEEADLVLKTVDKGTADDMLVLARLGLGSDSDSNTNPNSTNSNANTKEEVKPVTVVTSKDKPGNTTTTASNPTNSNEEVKPVTVITSRDKPDNATTTTTTTTAFGSTIKLLPGESYSISSSSIYSASNPIPIDQQLPEGLIFKVQLGAFKNTIRQDLFKGISPVMGETTPKGFIRYTVGIFVKFETADAVKNEVKGMGFKDAFVVAFYNGKRIPINDALARIGRTDLIAAAATPATNQTEPNRTTGQGNDANKNNAVGVNQNDNINAVMNKATDLTKITGLIYTVQVGVYTKKSKATKLRGINPLFRENLPDGTIRFTTGKYTDISLANIARNSVVLNNGIKDAFVSAYYNGKRITMAEARRMQSQNSGIPQPANNVKEENQPIIENKVIEPANGNTNIPPDKGNAGNSVASQNTKLFPSDTGVVFRIQLGAFKGDVPLDIANKYLKISKQGIKNYRDENGLTVYTVGATKSYEEANALKQNALNAGIQDAFVIAFYFGQKITLDEAMPLINK